LAVQLPAPLRPGATFSGSIALFPAGRKRLAAKNRRKLERLQLAIGTTTVPATTSRFTLSLAAGARYLNLELRDRRGRPQTSQRIDLEPGEAPAGDGIVSLPPTCRAGRPLVLTGPFDGDSRTTRVTFGGTATEVLAETTGSVIVACPPDQPGRNALAVEEAGLGRVGVASFQVIELELELADPVIHRGTETTLTVELSGLAGLDRPVVIVLENKSPEIVRLAGGTQQRLRLEPSAWGEQDRLRLPPFGVFGLHTGSAVFELSLVPTSEYRLIPHSDG
jgi:hypothetical protein